MKVYGGVLIKGVDRYNLTRNFWGVSVESEGKSCVIGIHLEYGIKGQ